MPTYCSASECISSVAERYRAIQSYSDVGIVRLIGKLNLPSCWFETHFVRPQQFRCQFIRPHPYRPLRHLQTKYIVGSDGAASYLYTQPPGSKSIFEAEEDLRIAVAGATGISSGAAHTVSELLLECVGGFSLTMLNRLHFRRARSLDGVLCHRISGRHPRGGRVVIWIGVNDLLIRKIVKHYLRHEEVRFNILANTNISLETFRVPNSVT